MYKSKKGKNDILTKRKTKRLNKCKWRESKRVNFMSRLDEVNSHALFDTEMVKNHTEMEGLRN